MENKASLTESDRIEIIHLVKTYKNQWKRIGQLINKKPDTVKKFYLRYTKSQTIFPKKGRPPIITQKEKDDVCSLMLKDPTQTLEQVSSEFSFAKSTKKKY